MKIYEQTLALQRPDSQFKAELCLIHASLDSLKKHLSKFLHEAEYAYFSSLKYEKRQHSYLLGRYAAKQAIARYYGLTHLNSFFIETGVFQQPVVQCKAFEKIQVSLSHCDSFGIALVFPELHPLGIDLEYIQTDPIQSHTFQEIKNKLTQKELELFDTLFYTRSLDLKSLDLKNLKPLSLNTSISNSSNSKLSSSHSLSSNSLNLLEYRSSIFYLCFWTAKEALSKALKTGFMISWELLEINNILQYDDFFICEFTHFFQYHVASFILDNLVISIVYPKKTNIHGMINIHEIKQWLKSISTQYQDEPALIHDMHFLQ